MGVAVGMQLQEVGGALAALVSRLENREPLMAQLAGYLEASTLARFSAQRGPGGEPWKQSIRARLTGGMTLRDRGGLMGSLASAHTQDSAEVGTNKIYGPMMHFGGTVHAKGGGVLRFRIPGVGWRSAKEVTIPARLFLGIDDEDDAEIGHIVFDYLAAQAPA